MLQDLIFLFKILMDIRKISSKCIENLGTQLQKGYPVMGYAVGIFWGLRFIL